MKLLTTFLICLLLINEIFSQNNCDCNHIINGLSTENINIINASEFEYSPGDTFCFESGTYRGVRLIGFVGEKNKPLIFKNINGIVLINEPSYPAIELKRSKYVRFAGDGCDDSFYGFNVESGTTAVSISEFSSDIEIDHIEVLKSGFAGIMAKTNPECSDENTWRRNGYIMKNLKLHHNYIKNTEGEGFYIGSTDGYKIKTRLKCNNEYVFAHWLENVEIYNNKIENAGWDAIQVNLVRKEGKVYNNTVYGYGMTTDNGYQKFGMSIGGGIYSIYNNFINNDGSGKGLQFISAQSGTKIFNNVLVSPKSDAIFMHSRHLLEGDTGYYVMNNTIINPEKSGIKLITSITESINEEDVGKLQLDKPSYFINNVIANPGNTYELQGTWKGVDENYIDFNSQQEKIAFEEFKRFNLQTKNIEEVGFKDFLNGVYEAKNEESLLVDVGENLSKFGVSFDFNGNKRPQNKLFDVGAFEYTLNNNQGNNKTRVIVYPNPTNNELIIKSNLEVKEISIYTLYGKRIKYISKLINNQFSLKDLSKGFYIVEVDFLGDKKIFKIFKE
ncbi:T9SS type A sorting domain-containing protein [Tenacibaculum crassostreae]|uniref:T9SS type A sorting domain-containing protein n=1 Tax=Tenacibaculum crassostreae TaxID=502683 RepID=UPI00389500B7